MRRRLALFLALVVLFTSIPFGVWAKSDRVNSIRKIDRVADEPDMGMQKRPEVPIEKDAAIDREEALAPVQKPESLPQVAMMRAPAPRERIEINSKEDFLKLWNTTEYYSGFGPSSYQPGPGYDKGDAWHHGVKNKDIVLNVNIEVSSDEINAPIQKNEHDPIHNFGFGMEDCTFNGNNHTITVTKGTRDIYPLFGDIRSTYNNETSRDIKDLNILYKGDVVGSAFARNILSSNSFSPVVDYKISNIKVNVDGNILPYATLIPAKQSLGREDIQSSEFTGFPRFDTETFAVGMAYLLDSAEIDGYTLNVKGDIGSPEVKKHNLAKTDLVYARASGLFIRKNMYDFKVFAGVKNVDIHVGGGIYAHAQNFRAEAFGIGSDVQNKRYTALNIDVKGDIEAKATGKIVFTKNYSYGHEPSMAAGFARDLHQLENSKINVGGSIRSINETDIDMDTTAAGIGLWDYINNHKGPGESGLTDENSLEKYPQTIKNVEVTVGGDIYAESTKAPKFNTNIVIGTEAVGGMLNTMESGLRNFDDFSNNKIKINGDIVAKSAYGQVTKAAFSRAYLWGYFTGNNNEFSANSIKSTAKDNFAYAAPYLHFLKGEKNKVSVPGGIFVDSLEDYAAGVATNVTEYDGEKNTTEVGPITTTHPAEVAGFATEIRTHKHHSNPKETDKRKFYVAPVVKNVHIEPEIIVNSDGQEGKSKVWLGGFTGYNAGTIENCSVRIKAPIALKVSEDAKVGGFVAENAGKILNSSACIKSIEVDGGGNHLNVAGFAAYGNGDAIRNSSAFVNDSINVTNGNYVNVGGFRGIAFDCTDDNNAAQIGEDLTATENKGPVTIGGYAGKIQAHSGTLNPEVKNSTSLVFGDVKGQTTAPSFNAQGAPILGNTSAGFIGVVRGKVFQDSQGRTGVRPVDVFDSAAYVGGKMISEYPDKNRINGSVGILFGGRLKGFTVIANYTDDGAQNVITANNYLEGMGYSKFDENTNYYVEVKDGKRTAWPIYVSDQPDGSQSFDKTNPDKPIGEIEIAHRTFQKDYWEKDASPEKVTLPYKDFDYVKNNGGLTLEGFSKDKDTIATGTDFSKATLEKYCARHMAIRSNKVTYDILGIPSPAKVGKVIFDLNYKKDDGNAAGKYKEVEGTLGLGLADKFPPNPQRSGYEFLGWNTAADGKGAAFTKDSLVNEDVTVYAQWKKIEKPVTPPTPAKPGGQSYFVPSVKLNTKDHFAYLFGYPDSTFRPDKSMTRAEVAAMFVRLMEKAPDASAASFKDVAPGAWYYDYIAKAEAAGILKGYEDGSFRPQGEITRAEFAAIATRFDKLSPAPMAFTDVANDYWAHDAIAAAYGKGWIAGYEDNTFRPTQSIKRSEVAALTNQVLNRFADKDWVQANRQAIINFTDVNESHWAFYPITEATNGHDYTRKPDGKNETWIQLNHLERR
ncbi:S-layer homology domain-containing protein [Aedoeadaptatus pacaensis]|uniref:S-layer homology domain-containing protein n=1 Tax=Aedoeadaptatus pacaensis TaxID=1776390 RepID=UPI0008398E8F|nr:S-layer homology domain-containing protein [Peptoniphilus pacaensis]